MFKNIGDCQETNGFFFQYNDSILVAKHKKKIALSNSFMTAEYLHYVLIIYA